LFLTKATLNLISKNTLFIDCDVAAYHALCRMCLVCRGGQTTRHILHSARYAAASQSTNEVFLLIKLSVALVRNNVCPLKMIELLKHVGAN
jgi:hypothetical protein